MRSRLIRVCENGPRSMAPDEFCAKHLFWIGMVFFWGGIVLTMVLMATYQDLLQGTLVLKIVAASPIAAGYIMGLAAYGQESARGHAGG